MAELEHNDMNIYTSVHTVQRIKTNLTHREMLTHHLQTKNTFIKRYS